jgi:sterol 3beta-glucosyltransferase
MHITLMTTGTLGDVQPYLALALGLRQAGHRVRLATQRLFESLVRSYGFEFAPITGDFQQLLASDEGQSLLNSGQGLQFVQRFLKALDDQYEAILLDSWNACQGTEAIIFNGSLFSGGHVAEKMQIPVFTSFFFPVSPTKYFPNPVLPLPKWLNLGSTFNRLSYALLERPAWLRFMERTNRWRTEFLHLPPIPLSGGYVYYNKRQLPWLYCYSNQIVQPTADWPGWMNVTGYWHLEQPLEWQPPKKLTDFLNAGPKPVYVGFGSMVSCQPEKRTDLVIEALRQSGQRGLLYGGWGGLIDTELPDHVLKVDPIPHDWLFPKCAAVVHHGGVGTTHSALRAGVPSIVIPFFGDQPFWGRRIDALGAGPSPIRQTKLTVTNLTKAIQVAVETGDIQKRASGLGERLRSENGVSRAIELFHQQLERPGKFLSVKG